MGQEVSVPSEQDLEEGLKTVVLVHGLASCALREATEGSGFLCDYCKGSDSKERLLWVSISELAKRPHMMKRLGLSWELAVAKNGVKTMKTSCGYENVVVHPVPGLEGIRTLNPGTESTVTPVYLWHSLIEHLSEFNLLAFNYDWRRWGDLVYIEQLVVEFRHQIELAAHLARQPVVIIGHSLGTQVVTYMLGLLGPQWTKANVSDLVLVGPATMGSPSVFGAYANGPSTITHSSVLPVAELLEHRLRDVASTWPGLLSVLPTALDDVDTFGNESMAVAPRRSYGTAETVEFLQDLAACHDEEAESIFKDENFSLHERTRRWMEEHEILQVKRTWSKQFEKAAVLRKGFEQEVVPHLKPPNCRVHVIYADGIETLSKLKFEQNLYRKAKLIGFEKGDDTITARSVDKMCEAWRNAGVVLHQNRAGKVHHKELISCPFTLRVLDHVMAQDDEYSSEMDESEDGCCGA